MRYPATEPEAIPGSGGAIYLYLLENVSVPGSLPHVMWYEGLKKQMENPASTAMRGYYPVGETHKISYAGSPMGEHKFTGNEQNAVFVKDLAPETALKLGISKDRKPDEKVFNPNFLPWPELPDEIHKLNELPALSLAKSISGWCSQKSPYYTELDVRDFLVTATKHPSGEQMMYILHGNHVAWCTHRFITAGASTELEADIKKEFYTQNSPDFYIKDLGTIFPSMLYVLGLLGEDVISLCNNLPFDLWGVSGLASEIDNMMKRQKAQAA
jgi:hypothetical protein